MSKQKAFTLIELLVVVSIISLLASIVFAATAEARAKGRDAARVSEVHEVGTALELYNSDHNSYPVGTYYSSLDTTSGSDGNCWCSSPTTNGGLEQALVGGSYLAKLPEDPTPQVGTTGNYLSDGQGRGYVYVSDGKSYVLGTYLEVSNTPPPSSNSTSSCSAAGNFQVSSGNLDSSNCPTVTAPLGGGSTPTSCPLTTGDSPPVQLESVGGSCVCPAGMPIIGGFAPLTSSNPNSPNYGKTYCMVSQG